MMVSSTINHSEQTRSESTQPWVLKAKGAGSLSAKSRNKHLKPPPGSQHQAVLSFLAGHYPSLVASDVCFNNNALVVSWWLWMLTVVIWMLACGLDSHYKHSKSHRLWNESIGLTCRSMAMNMSRNWRV
jgi:hypothetical protein